MDEDLEENLDVLALQENTPCQSKMITFRAKKCTMKKMKTQQFKMHFQQIKADVKKYMVA